MGFVSILLEDRCLRAVTLTTGETLVRADEGPPGDDAVFERIDLAHGRVALRVADGRYLARHVTHLDREDVPVTAGALHLVDELTACAAFEELTSSDGTVSLRGCDLRFLGVHDSGAVVADRVSDGSWERFRYVEAAAPLPRVPSQAGAADRPTTLAAV